VTSLVFISTIFPRYVIHLTERDVISRIKSPKDKDDAETSFVISEWVM
jgi:hypothetical protein